MICRDATKLHFNLFTVLSFFEFRVVLGLILCIEVDRVELIPHDYGSFDNDGGTY